MRATVLQKDGCCSAASSTGCMCDTHTQTCACTSRAVYYTAEFFCSALQLWCERERASLSANVVNRNSRQEQMLELLPRWPADNSERVRGSSQLSRPLLYKLTSLVYSAKGITLMKWRGGIESNAAKPWAKSESGGSIVKSSLPTEQFLFTPVTTATTMNQMFKEVAGGATDFLDHRKRNKHRQAFLMLLGLFVDFRVKAKLNRVNFVS